MSSSAAKSRVRLLLREAQRDRLLLMLSLFASNSPSQGYCLQALSALVVLWVMSWGTVTTIVQYSGLLCNTYSTVWRSISDIYREVVYRGYGPTYRAIYTIYYGECATDKPFA